MKKVYILWKTICRLVCFLPKTWLSHLLVLNVLNERYTRNAIFALNKISVKIPKASSETVNRRRRHLNSQVWKNNRTNNALQNTKDRLSLTPLKAGVKPGAQEGLHQAVPASHVAHPVLLLLQTWW